MGFLGLILLVFIGSMNESTLSKDFVQDFGVFRLVMYVAFICCWYISAPHLIEWLRKRKLAEVEDHPKLTAEKIEHFNAEMALTAKQAVTTKTMLKVMLFITLVEVVLIRQFIF